MGIFLAVFGGIYGGVFSPTEGAGVGAVLTLLLGLFKKELKLSGMQAALLSTAETTAMVFMIFLGADMMNATLALTEMPKMVASWVSGLPVPPLGIVTAVLLLYIVLGCVMDELSMLLLTIPVIFPAVMALDLWGLTYEYKALWFGILVLMTVSFGLIAPPVGLNVYVVNNLARDVPMSETYKGLAPFLVWDIVRLGVLLVAPALSLWMVTQLFTR
jgi:TRAP-type C4-dicarboxylate transport system permease large subunit